MLIIDNFETDPDKTRLEAIKANYISYKAQDVVYHGIAPTDFSKYKKLFEEHLKKEIKPIVSFYRYYTKDLASPNYIHADMNFCSHIAIQFLHKDLQGGFATWSHKETNLIKATLPLNEDILKKLRDDSKDENKWNRETLVHSRFNRCVIYDADGFHSHYPKQLWGSTPEDGRLIQVFFFNA